MYDYVNEIEDAPNFGDAGGWGGLADFYRDKRKLAGLTALGEALARAGTPAANPRRLGGAFSSALSAYNNGPDDFDQRAQRDNMTDQVNAIKSSPNFGDTVSLDGLADFNRDERKKVGITALGEALARAGTPVATPQHLGSAFSSDLSGYNDGIDSFDRQAQRDQTQSYPFDDLQAKMLQREGLRAASRNADAQLGLKIRKIPSDWGVPEKNMRRSPSGSRPLNECEISVLTPYTIKKRHLNTDTNTDTDIDMIDLEEANLYDGTVPWYLLEGFGGITRNNDIHVRPGRYKPKTPDGLGLLAHELAHVKQYRKGMNLLSYIWASKFGYEENPYENSAYKFSDKVIDDLTKRYGNEPICP